MRNTKRERVLRRGKLALAQAGALPPQDTSGPCPVPGCKRKRQPRRHVRVGERSHLPCCPKHWREYLDGADYIPWHDGIRVPVEDSPLQWFGKRALPDGSPLPDGESYDAMYNRYARDFADEGELLALERMLTSATERS